MSEETKMTDRTLGKSLMKNGVWQVPIAERPDNWQAISLKECVEQTERRDEEPKEARHPDVLEPVIEAVVAVEAEAESLSVAPPPVERIDVAPLISFIPDDNGETTRQLLDRIFAYEAQPNETLEEENLWTAKMEHVFELFDPIHAHRVAKSKVDIPLSDWAHRHRKAIRHLGLKSPAIQDLWNVVHRMILSEMSEADRRVRERK